MWKNTVETQATDDSVAWHMCFACWLTDAKDTHS